MKAVQDGYHLKPRKSHYLRNRSLLISALQKLIRRQLNDQAQRVAMVLMEYHLKDIVRRLPIIVCEDCILHPAQYELAKIMMKVSENYQVSKEDVSLVLTVVNDLCNLKVRDQIDQKLIKQYNSKRTSYKLSPKADGLVTALKRRARYGGMRWDMDVLFALDVSKEIVWYENIICVVGIVNDDPSVVPVKHFLHNNYPNPFNPVTTLRYDLPEHSNVTITIYDMLGREVKTLVNQSQEAGYKSVIWNATNNYGKPVSAGVYLYQIRAGEYVQTKKMVFLK